MKIYSETEGGLWIFRINHKRDEKEREERRILWRWKEVDKCQKVGHMGRGDEGWRGG